MRLLYVRSKIWREGNDPNPRGNSHKRFKLISEKKNCYFCSNNYYNNNYDNDYYDHLIISYIDVTGSGLWIKISKTFYLNGALN